MNSTLKTFNPPLMTTWRGEDHTNEQVAILGVHKDGMIAAYKFPYTKWSQYGLSLDGSHLLKPLQPGETDSMAIVMTDEIREAIKAAQCETISA